MTLTASAAAALLLGLQGAAPSLPPPNRNNLEIVVTPPITQGERREQLRDFARAVIREPRRGLPIARFRFPVCAKVIGLADDDARAIETRIHDNAARIGLGADPDPDCTPTIRAAFMAPGAGPPESWLSDDSPQLAHLPIWQRRELQAEAGPVRAFNRVIVRDHEGQPINGSEKNGRVMDAGIPTLVDPLGASDPINVAEITGAAILIEREAADGFTLAQLADYITLRTLLATGTPDADTIVAAPTILTLFQGRDAPAGMTSFDEALLQALYRASRNSTPRRVISDVAVRTVRAERAEPSGER